MTDYKTEQEMQEPDWETAADEERMERAQAKAEDLWLEENRERTAEAKENIAEIKAMYREYVACLKRQEKICHKLLKMAMEKRQ